MIIKKSISDQVLKEFRDNIENGVWKPGKKIPSENQLTEIYGVSRISVRNAIHRLVSLGWLETQHGKGTFVRELGLKDIINADVPTIKLDYEDIIKVLVFRNIIETESAALAAENANEDNIKSLKCCLDNMEKFKNNHEEMLREDYNFHIEVAKSTKNDLIVTVLTILRDVIKKNIETNVSLRASNTINFHKKIYEAIEKRNIKAARNAMKEHMNYNIQRVKEVKEKGEIE